MDKTDAKNTPAYRKIEEVVFLCEAQAATLGLLWNALQSNASLSPVVTGIKANVENGKLILCDLLWDMERGKLVWVPEKNKEDV